MREPALIQVQLLAVPCANADETQYVSMPRTGFALRCLECSAHKPPSFPKALAAPVARATSASAVRTCDMAHIHLAKSGSGQGRWPSSRLRLLAAWPASPNIFHHSSTSPSETSLCQPGLERKPQIASGEPPRSEVQAWQKRGLLRERHTHHHD